MEINQQLEQNMQPKTTDQSQRQQSTTGEPISRLEPHQGQLQEQEPQQVTASSILHEYNPTRSAINQGRTPDYDSDDSRNFVPNLSTKLTNAILSIANALESCEQEHPDNTEAVFRPQQADNHMIHAKDLNTSTYYGLYKTVLGYWKFVVKGGNSKVKIIWFGLSENCWNALDKEGVEFDKVFRLLDKQWLDSGKYQYVRGKVKDGDWNTKQWKGGVHGEGASSTRTLGIDGW